MPIFEKLVSKGFTFDSHPIIKFKNDCLIPMEISDIDTSDIILSAYIIFEYSDNRVRWSYSSAPYSLSSEFDMIEAIYMPYEYDVVPTYAAIKKCLLNQDETPVNYYCIYHKETVKEVTMEDICKKFGCNVKIVKEK